MMREVSAAQQTLTEITGAKPKFFRAPAGLRNMFLAPVLSRLNLQLAHWSIRAYDTKARNPERVEATLLGGLKPGAIILLHDGNAARTKSDLPMILAVLPSLVEAARQQNLRFVTLSQAAQQNLAYV
jgi:peptidoglycan/xylan/chitin deacetylase (PgdA/CDA1 family)